MNHVYQSIWNQCTGTFVAASEITKTGGKKSSAGRSGEVRGGLDFKALTIALLMVFASSSCWSLPGNGVVSAGTATLAAAPGSLTVNQASQNAAINWQSFNIKAGEAVKFVQPNSASVMLNRVIGTDPSSIFGSMTANGKVFLVNPNGILFGKDASINVSGLVASTLSITDANFMAGRYIFERFSGIQTGSVVNQGSINASGGYVALLGANISNQGVIAARLGTVTLAAGNAITLDVAGDGLLNIKVDQGAVNALVQNSGLIQADGGKVLLTAQAAGNLLKTVVNNTGLIQARTLENRSGTIMLLGDMQNGTVNAGGTLDASAPHNGNGGFIETSAANLKISDALTITTASSSGKTGTWLIDPNDYTIAASGGDITGTKLGSDLTKNNITILSSSGATHGGTGNINVNDTVNWTANTLTLTAAKDININAVMTAGGSSKLVLNTGTTNGASSGQINMGLGTSGFTGRVDIPTRTGTGILAVNGIDYSVIQSLGGQTDATTVPAILTLQGLANVANMSGNYAQGSDIDARPTSGWNEGRGFTPIGSTAAPFKGSFNGLGHAILNLAINQTGVASMGLFGDASGSTTIGNIGLVGGTVVGGAGSGGLIGANTTGSVNNSYNTGNVTGGAGSGGLVGAGTTGSISNSFTTGVVTGGAGTGGLIGALTTGGVDNSFTTGNVIGLNGSVRSAGTGGLVGEMTTGNISNSHTTGNVSGGAGTGGVVGALTTGSVLNNYATGTVDGAAGTGGLIGTITTGAITNNYATGNVTGAAGTGGLVGTGTTGLLSLNSATGNVSGGTGAGVGGLIGTTTGNMSQNYATGSVTGGAGTGGLAGTTTGNIDNSYASGNVNATAGGGLVGTTTGKIDNSYASGTAAATGGVDGIAGTSTGSITKTFWDKTKNPHSGFVGSEGKTSADMAAPSTFSAAGWDPAIWNFSGSTPILKALIRTVTVNATADNVSKIYDNQVYSGFTATFSNPAFTSASYTGSLTYSGAGTKATDVGSYAVTPGGLTVINPQYVVKYVDGILTINKRPLSGTISASSSVYGQTLVAGTVNLSNLATGDAGLVTSGPVTFTTAGNTSNSNTLKAGSYAGSSGIQTVASGSLGGSKANNYSFAGMTGDYTVTKAPLIVSGIAVVDKVYDGGTVATFDSSTPVMSGLVSGDQVTVGMGAIKGAFVDKNVGNTKAINLSGSTLSGADVGNYATPTLSSSVTGNITRRGSVAWTGGAGTTNWFDPANWTGGAVPDLSNVSNVVIPANVVVTFNSGIVVAPAQMGTVNVDNVTGGTASGMNLNAGTINVANAMTVAALTQSGGTLAGTGNVILDAFNQSGGSVANTGSFTVNKSFVQTAPGSVAAGGTISITQATGDLILSSLAGKNLVLTATNGAVSLGTTTSAGTLDVTAGTNILQTGSVRVTGVTTLTASTGDITLANPANDFTGAVNTRGRNITLADANSLVAGTIVASGALDVTALTGSVTQTTTGKVVAKGAATLAAAAGDITLTNAANDFTGAVNASGRNIALTDANSIFLGNINVTGTLTVKALNGDITQTPRPDKIFVTGTASLEALNGNITLPNPDNVFSGGVTTTTKVGGTATVSGTSGTTGTSGTSGTTGATGLSSVLTVVTNVLQAESPSTTPASSTSLTPKPLAFDILKTAETALPLSSKSLTPGSINSIDVAISLVRAPSEQTTGIVLVSVSLPEEFPVSGGVKFEFTLPAQVTANASPGTPVIVTTLAGGPLPSWLRYVPAINGFAADEVPASALPIQIVVTVGKIKSTITISRRP